MDTEVPWNTDYEVTSLKSIQGQSFFDISEDSSQDLLTLNQLLFSLMKNIHHSLIILKSDFSKLISFLSLKTFLLENTK